MLSQTGVSPQDTDNALLSSCCNQCSSTKKLSIFFMERFMFFAIALFEADIYLGKFG